MSDKVFEAKEHCKAAEKALKTTIFRWKPDYDSAADEYSQAAQCYRIARDLPNSKECHLKASECFKKNNAFFHAAKSLENAMIVNKEATAPEEIYNLAMESSSLYQQHGSGDSGASVLDKAAKLIESTAPELAVKLFQQAADVSSRKEGEGEGSDWMDLCDSDASEDADDTHTSVDSEDLDIGIQRITRFAPKEIENLTLPGPSGMRYSMNYADAKVGSLNDERKEGEGEGSDWMDLCDSDASEDADDTHTPVDSEDLDIGIQRITRFAPKEIVNLTLPGPSGMRYSMNYADAKVGSLNDERKEGEGEDSDWMDLCDSDASEDADDTHTSVDSEDLDIGIQRIACFAPKEIVNLILPGPSGMRYSMNYADAKVGSLNDEPFLSKEAAAVKAREERGHINFMILCQEMQEFYLQRPGTTEDDKEMTRDVMHYMVEEYKRVVQYDRSKLSYAQKMRKFCKVIRKRRRQIIMLTMSLIDMSESSQHQGSEYISKASRILVKLQWYDQAVDSLRREIGFHQESGNTGAIGRLTVAIVLVQLARGDAVAAEKAYKEWGSNCEVAEMQTLEQILQAYDEEDRESAKRALASPFIRNMDVEYARLAATVPLPEAMEPAPRAAVRENAAPSYVSPNAQSTTTADVTNEQLEESPYEPVTYAKKSDDEDGLC